MSAVRWNATAEQWGGIDILVANAGIAVGGSVVDMSEAEWNKVLNTNLGGVYRLKISGIRISSNGAGVRLSI